LGSTVKGRLSPNNLRKLKLLEHIDLLTDKTRHSLPKAREKGLLIRELEDEVLVYDLQTHKAHCLNETAARVWQKCDGTRNVAHIALALSAETGVPVDEDIISLALNRLHRSRLMETELEGGVLTRREVIRRAGIAAAVALPVVTSILAPRAAEAATCLTTGTPCSSGSQCCSGLCSGVCG